ncbi:phosphoinositide 3-kinase adapter protein 1 isoform X2 [Hyperolius riggenbachi]|uniref:phosphoinositide 3-kinase adapter protein 1 isoform X2 n=1 Tax=Hyperolius riggenbachi TaxID=752182 RepID=UPI0035A385AF
MAMAAKGHNDLLLLYGPDAREWSQYLLSLFETHHRARDLTINTYELQEDQPVSHKDLKTFQRSKCILTLLSGDLEASFDNQNVLQSLRTVLRPAHKVIILFCGVMDKEDFTNLFQDWPRWKQLSSDDDPDLYVTAVKETLLYDSGCGTISSDTEPESEEEIHLPVAQGNLLSLYPERIRCGVKTEIYLIFKCKLDSRIKNEVYFNPLHGSPVRIPATLHNEYSLSVEAPDLPSGPVSLKVFSGDLVICEAQITYFTDMEEICHLLDSASNPVEFMCQAFKITPYNREALDKLLTESLKNNIPATGLHLFGINQIEEENLSANQRDEELPTLLHFSAKYGLKNLTALLLTCPGALQAYSVSNKHGDFPNYLAEKYGFKDLRQFIDEYVETADLLKTHFKEELMQGEGGDPMYVTMANLSTDILMKCSLNPGSDEDLYESMVGLVPQLEGDETYIDMSKPQETDSSFQNQGMTAQDSMLRKILEGTNLDIYVPKGGDGGGEEDQYDVCSNYPHYDDVSEAIQPSSVAASRPPVPYPRPEEPPDTKPYISQGASIRVRRDRLQSSVYDPFAGMKTPGQRELIRLQESVKLGIITVEEAVLQFKEWQLNQKRRSESFRYQQENLRKLRDSINRRRNENRKAKKSPDFNITEPIRRHQNVEAKTELAAPGSTPKRDLRRGNWKTESTSSTTSSSSSRSSTRSILSISSGMEGDNEDSEIPEQPPRLPRRSVPEVTPPPRPPRVGRSTRRSQSTSSSNQWDGPPVPPRGRQ